jgi:hypothetical protein
LIGGVEADFVDCCPSVEDLETVKHESRVVQAQLKFLRQGDKASSENTISSSMRKAPCN